MRLWPSFSAERETPNAPHVPTIRRSLSAVTLSNGRNSSVDSQRSKLPTETGSTMIADAPNRFEQRSHAATADRGGYSKLTRCAASGGSRPMPPNASASMVRRGRRFESVRWLFRWKNRRTGRSCCRYGNRRQAAGGGGPREPPSAGGSFVLECFEDVQSGRSVGGGDGGAGSGGGRDAAEGERDRAGAGGSRRRRWTVGG